LFREIPFVITRLEDWRLLVDRVIYYYKELVPRLRGDDAWIYP